ncbi:hypothetical protein JM654_18440 [Microbacterium oxydans]|nr:hypothetical protein [Microbacterium oxydans]
MKPPSRSAAAEKTSPEASEKSADPSAKAPAAEGYVPVAEILAMPSASAQVVQGVQVGQRLAAEGVPDFILGSADLVVTITVPVTDLGDVVAGDAAVISIGGTEVEGTVGGHPPLRLGRRPRGNGRKRGRGTGRT